MVTQDWRAQLRDRMHIMGKRKIKSDMRAVRLTCVTLDNVVVQFTEVPNVSSVIYRTCSFFYVYHFFERSFFIICIPVQDSNIIKVKTVVGLESMFAQSSGAKIVVLYIVFMLIDPVF